MKHAVSCFVHVFALGLLANGLAWLFSGTYVEMIAYMAMGLVVDLRLRKGAQQ